MFTIHLVRFYFSADFNRLAQVGLFGAYGESLWGLAQFTLPTESSCLCAFGADNKSIVGMCILCTCVCQVYNSYMCMSWRQQALYVYYAIFYVSAT